MCIKTQALKIPRRVNFEEKKTRDVPRVLPCETRRWYELTFKSSRLERRGSLDTKSRRKGRTHERFIHGFSTVAAKVEVDGDRRWRRRGISRRKRGRRRREDEEEEEAKVEEG